MGRGRAIRVSDNALPADIGGLYAHLVKLACWNGENVAVEHDKACFVARSDLPEALKPNNARRFARVAAKRLLHGERLALPQVKA